ncbi:uncharacterized protein [Aegilops tauschii subsp. strangulata]|uniref:F-box protein AT5G49610-like beta-propeller domain-containing protein n=2 Tax=Aegilops tauschii TaxID=37682 RepID=A0A453DTF2_AEGTS|nr:uncharacterized protein LOC120976358 [Aegilops tauschii subsp. strangulata]XP_040259184.1 uncharacterized protein LOC120976358 [Aegilops tauschii subsp. strangulata]
MVSPQQPAAAKKPTPLPPTTISALDLDTLREIFLCLPSLPSLVRAALSCHTFLDAVRSSPAFRRRFRALHPPPLLGHFLTTQDTTIRTFVPLRSRSDPDIAAAVRGGDFFLTRLPVPEDDGAVSIPAPVSAPEDSEGGVSVPVPAPAPEDDDMDAIFGFEDDDEDPVPEDPVPEWSIDDCRDGFVVLDNWSTQQIAVYNPLARTLDLFPLPPRQEHSKDCERQYSDYYILAEKEEDSLPYRVVCVWHSEHGARAMVLSSDTSNWQIFPWADIDGFWPGNGKMVNGCIYWTNGMTDARVLNTATMQFSRMDKPPRMRGHEVLTAGETKDGRLCVVCAPLGPLTFESVLAVWIRRADDDGVERWMLDKSLPLQEIAGIVRCGFRQDNVQFQVSVRAIIGGFVYFSAYCGVLPHDHSDLWLLSFCVETAALNKLGRIFRGVSYPYIMAWPRSLVGTQQGD